MQRNDNSVLVDVEPIPDNTKSFEDSFRSYLNLEVNVQDLYKDWSKRDPKYFALIA